VRELGVPDDANEISDGRLFLGEASKKYAGVDAEETSMAAILIPEFVSFSFPRNISRYRFIETERLFICIGIANIDNVC